ncbi:hypothetical protein GGS23DRAFT_248031 [Durotheca rogersii]|uniref:uncharacterized protein n=1 Tax=Durotheca rogersii TaxID=419775 RepID=UPI00221F2403|nr:uncharacterized protein GGS23DRAFT_248031 [Durotheca rogersii]KAI5860083.1 hypothetical protein GGS23DRAFT_248031 [Durotheca rogersii]
MVFLRDRGRLCAPHRWILILLAILLIPALYLLFQSRWAVQHPVSAAENSRERAGSDATNRTENGLPLSHYNRNNLTVNLVVASLQQDDISWTQNIQIPNLNIIRYVSDSMEAEYHPPVPRKGREALIYHTYMYDFYDKLPDITIFIHSDESPWHVEGTLNSSMTFALSHLDLEQVLQRRYFNLRVSWDGACPNWINTTKSAAEGNGQKKEEPYMREAFSENFHTNDVPVILAGPCCSQFAVTRDAVRRHPRSQYRITMDWLVQTGWTDYITGRVWEHMWPWLFKGEAVDCAVEWKAYCRMYHICFDADSRSRITSLEEEKKELEKSYGLLDELIDLFGSSKITKRVEEINAIMTAELENALERGKSEAVRMELLSDLYTS